MALTKVKSGMRTLATDEVTATEIAAGAVGASEIASTFDISSKTVTLPEISVTAHVTAFDDVPVRRDIATLALHTAISDNKAAYNLSNAFIDQYEDDTGIDVETNTDNVSEYIASVSIGGIDAYVKLMLHFDGSHGGTTFTDSSTTAHTVSSVDGGVQTNTSTVKFGTASAYFDGTGDRIQYTASTDFNLPHNAGDWTLDYWAYDTDADKSYGRHFGQENVSGSTYDGWHLGKDGTTSKMRLAIDNAGPLLLSTNAITENVWQHHCWEYDSSANTVKCWLAGVLNGTTTSASTGGNWTWHSQSRKLWIGVTNPAGGDYAGLLDEIRLSKGIARTQESGDKLYIASGTSFTPPTTAYSATTTNATGNFTSATQASTASVSSMGIVVLYKNNAGTASLNTDLVAEVSANGGTNYANATLVAGGTFSTGINIAAVSGVAVTAGTTPKYRISFANQSSGSKETQVHGVALLY